MRIEDVAIVSSGLVVARKKAIHQSDIVKRYKQLNLRCFNKNGYIENGFLEILEAKEIIHESYLTKENDIVIRLTEPFTAVYITKKDVGYVVSSNFCIVRCSNKCDSIFLSYYINSDNAKKKLLSNTQGSVMKNINISSIEELEIPRIPIGKQKTLGKLLLSQTLKIISANKILELEEDKQKAILEKITFMED